MSNKMELNASEKSDHEVRVKGPAIETKSDTWGPAVWKTLHIFAKRADEDSKTDFAYFVTHFQTLLPCQKCRDDFLELLSTDAPRAPYFEWSVRVHNAVNKKLGKKIFSFEEATRMYFSESVCTSCGPTDKPNSFLVVLILIAFFACLFLAFR